MPRVVARIGLALALAACGDAATTPPDASLNGLPELALVEELRIGSVDDPELGFSQIVGIEVADDGTMYVLEGQAREVRVYGPDGSLVRRFGGPGSGPGEFQGPSAVSLVGDTIAVAELTGNNRMTLFDREGNLGRTFQIQSLQMQFPEASMTMLVRPYRLREDGTFEQQVGTRFRLGPGGALPDRPDSIMVPRILFDAEGAPRDTTGWYPMRFGRVEVAGGTAVALAPMLPDFPLTAEVGGDSLIVDRAAATEEDGAAFTVTRLRMGGDTVYRHRIGYAPIPVSAAYRDSVVEARVEAYRGRPTPVDLEEVRRALEAELEWPAFHPPVRALHVGQDGEVWLLREVVGGDTRWTVLGADGTPRGHLVLPAGLSLGQSDGDRVWGVERDAVEVPWLVRYRIEGG